MKELFYKNLTDTKVKTALEQLIEAHQENIKQLADGIRAVNQQFKDNAASDIYTPEYLRTVYEQNKDSLLATAQKKATALNAKAVQLVDDLKRKSFRALGSFEKPSDYATKINNALQFIQIEGADITDSTAYNILHEFIDDMETMQHFRRVIEKQIAPSGKQISDEYGNTTFPLTFGRLLNFEKFVNALTELEEMTSTLFIKNLTETETEFLHGMTISVPMDSYMQLVTERNIIEQAETVENMIVELFTTND